MSHLGLHAKHGWNLASESHLLLVFIDPRRIVVLLPSTVLLPSMHSELYGGGPAMERRYGSPYGKKSVSSHSPNGR